MRAIRASVLVVSLFGATLARAQTAPPPSNEPPPSEVPPALAAPPPSTPPPVPAAPPAVDVLPTVSSEIDPNLPPVSSEPTLPALSVASAAAASPGGTVVPGHWHMRPAPPFAAAPGEMSPTTSLPTQNASASTETHRVPIDPDEELPKGWFRIPRSTVIAHVGGYVRAHFIHDFNGLIDSPGQFLTTAIPTNGSGVPNTFFDVRPTRLNLDVRWNNDFANARFFFEIDFFTPSGAPRIRHAWAELGRVRFGQDWTTFTNGALVPPTLDFENPIAYVVQRDPLIRYTQPLRRQGLEIALSAEYVPPTVDPSVSMEVPGDVETRVPDIVSRFAVHRDRFDFSLHGMLRTIWFQPDAGNREIHLGWGFNLITAWRPVTPLSIYFQMLGGRGIGSYRGFYDLYVTDSGEIATFPLVGGTAGVQVQWLPDQKLRSTVVASMARRLGDRGHAAATVFYTEYYAANLVWRAVRYFDIGVEYLFGINHDFGGAQGHDHRIQFSVYAYLP